MSNKLSALTCFVLLLSLLLTGCGGQASLSNTQPAATPDANNSPVNTREAVNVTGNVTVEFWHACTGDVADMLEAQIQEFNSTNTLGITVKGIYKGGYNQILETVKTHYGSDNIADMVVVGGGGTEVLATGGVLTDVSNYVNRDGFDMNNIPESMRYYSQYYPGQVIQFPHLINTSMIYYNKVYYPDGFPETMEQWIAAAQKIAEENPGVYGMGLPLDTGYIQRPLALSLGAPGFTVKDGTEAAALDDGTLEQVMTDWRSWIDSGYCINPKGIDIPSEFMKGNVAAFPISCVNTVGFAQQAAENGIEIGCARNVVYGGYGSGYGGTGICILNSSTDQEVSACWEFIKFLYEDEQVVESAIVSGCVPLTYSAAESAEMQEFWETYPGGKIAFESLENASYNEWSPIMITWRDEIRAVLLEVINEGTMTPKEGIAHLKRRAALVFQ